MPSSKIRTYGQELEDQVLKTAVDMLATQTDAEKKKPSALIADVTVAAHSWPRFQGFDVYETEAVVRHVLEAASSPQGEVTCQQR